tara:strand:+ start:3041 stop:3520 length:480 start_codon:yes stop_codon:yes gene_type:complete
LGPVHLARGQADDCRAVHAAGGEDAAARCAEPVQEVAPGSEQGERQEAKPEPKPDIVVPPRLVQLPVTSTITRKVHEPVEEVVDPGPPVPETTAPKSIAAQSWEAQLLAHLERYRRFPARARAARQQGTVYIRFTMNCRMVSADSHAQVSTASVFPRFT